MIQSPRSACGVVGPPATPRQRFDERIIQVNDWERTPNVNELKDASDAALVVHIGRYSQPALAEAYRRHAGAVHALARRVMQSPTGAEEVVQEVFLRLWNSPERFDATRGTLRSFLLAQAHSKAVDMIRSDTARRAREQRDARSMAEAGYDLEHEVWDLATAERVRDALAGLPEGERSAIELAYFGGKTYREVATVLGEPEGTVKSRIRSGLKRLRSDLQQAGIMTGGGR